MKTITVDESAITSKLCPIRPKTTANATPHDAEIMLDVEWKTSGIVIEVMTANGI